MRYTEGIEYPGINFIKDNADFYKRKFMQDTILVFRNANLSYDQHEELQRVLGDTFGWFPNTTSGGIARYVENHSANHAVNKNNNTEVILPWHIEHPYLKNPIIAGLWNMFKFTLEKNHGETLFIDTAKIYEMLSDEDKQFLDKCIVNSFPYGNGTTMQRGPAVGLHWLTGETIIRFSLNDIRKDWHDLYSFDGRQATEEESERFIEIGNWVINTVWNSDEHLMVHQWQQGDLIIPDLHKLAHAVRGGFTPDDREFTGLWSYQTTEEESYQ
jgi:alpha-ketoglutarate-dependent taurine dioxygenase